MQFLMPFCTQPTPDIEARELSWLERRANNANVVGSIPIRARMKLFW